MSHHLALVLTCRALYSRSSVVPNTQTPVWDELWSVKNVPADATLQVEVLDKDEGSIHDDYIGKFETTIAPGAKEVELVSTVLKSVRGSFWLDVSISLQ